MNSFQNCYSRIDAAGTFGRAKTHVMEMTNKSERPSRTEQNKTTHVPCVASVVPAQMEVLSLGMGAQRSGSRTQAAWLVKGWCRRFRLGPKRLSSAGRRTLRAVLACDSPSKAAKPTVWTAKSPRPQPQAHQSSCIALLPKGISPSSFMPWHHVTRRPACPPSPPLQEPTVARS